MTQQKIDELLLKVKAHCPKTSTLKTDDELNELIQEFFKEYEICRKVDTITILLVCNECLTDGQKDDLHSDNDINEVSFWDIRVKKRLDDIPNRFKATRHGIEAYQLIESCRNSQLQKLIARV